jgi:hypothetical protein
MGTRFFGTEPRETNRRVFVLILYGDLILPLLSLSLSSFACNRFELAPKLSALIEQLMARRIIFRTPI